MDLILSLLKQIPNALAWILVVVVALSILGHFIYLGWVIWNVIQIRREKRSNKNGGNP